MPDVIPPLRPVEAFPMEHEGQECVVLRDPGGYARAMVVLPRAVVEIVALFDGTRSIVDVQAALMRKYGELVTRQRIEELVEALDGQGFLDSPRYAELRQSTDQAFLDAPTRPASHAGGAYPDGAEALRETFDGFFAEPEGPGPVDEPTAPGAVTAVVAPHIDFHRGGHAYAWAYRDVAERCAADLFLIFGTCHAGMADPFALTRKDYETPLGAAPIDRGVVDALAARAGQDCFGSELAHRAEHSIEFQAVFLRYLFAGRREITIVPVLMSFAHEALARGKPVDDDPRVSRFLDAVRDVIATSGRRVAVIAGADLAHVGPRFGDRERVTPAGLAEIGREDRSLLEAVTAGDAAGFFDSVARDNDRRRICGLSPIYALLKTIPGGRGTLRRYGQWPDPDGVVTFASVVFDA
jgi:AmmeMemoRadiSam system protein B